MNYTVDSPIYLITITNIKYQQPLIPSPSNIMKIVYTDTQSASNANTSSDTKIMSGRNLILFTRTGWFKCLYNEVDR